MNYRLSHIAGIINAEAIIVNDAVVDHLLLDSRKIYSAATSLFFALKGQRRDGHQFIPELYEKNIRNFVVSEKIDTTKYPEANFLFADDTLKALQQLAAYHRKQFNSLSRPGGIPVIGITGSNGKTIVKEWLYHLLHEDYNIVRSPKSYNSQIGVPLSVWQMSEQHTLAILEAGISQQGEMGRLQSIIQPTIGILTNIGEAHSEGFIDQEHKFREKLALFKNCAVVIGKEFDFENRKEFIELLGEDIKVLTWGFSKQNEFIVRAVEKKDSTTDITLIHHSGEKKITIPFTDDASIENAITCFCVLLYLSIDDAVIRDRMKKLQPVNMRLEMKNGINNCVIINDSYSADLSSLEIALNFLDQQSGVSKKTIILSDFLQSGLPDEELYDHILSSLKKHNVSRLIGIGERISGNLQSLSGKQNQELSAELFVSTEDFIKQFRSSHFKEEIILVKGARLFAFEQIVQLLEQKAHQTILEINLNAIVHNLKEYQKLLMPATKVMAMVKAFAYGSGGAEIAGILQYYKVDYLGVAYADEGVELRKAGISLPIMVMNPEESTFESIIEHNLEPEIYSFDILNSFDAFLQREGLRQYPVHIEVETGMNRLGFETGKIKELAEYLQKANTLKVQTVFTHLAASEDPQQDPFTFIQRDKFISAAIQLEKGIGYSVTKHLGNSAAIVRYPELQMDMVRLGIGLYGIDSTQSERLNLQAVASLKSTIAQLKYLKAGESVSYNRKSIVEKDSVIATIRIGYADGYPRRLGNGVGKIWVKEKLAPVIGAVCMDMTMINVTGIPDVQEGDEVIIFGKELPVQQIAEWAETIPYEIMTGISQRVKRVYFEE